MSKPVGELSGVLNRRKVERVWGGAIEVELYLEMMNLRCLEIMVEAAENDYFKTLERRKKDRGITDRDLKRRLRIVDVRREAFDKEYARLMTIVPDEEEALIELLTQMESPLDDLIAERLKELADPEREEELIERFTDENDPYNPWVGLDDQGGDDFTPLQPL